MVIITHASGDSSILSNKSDKARPRNPRKKTSSNDKRLLEPKPEVELPLFKPRLEIRSAPLEERVRSRQNAYILVISPHNIRAAGGLYSADEAHEIARLTKGWDFRLDADGRPRCLRQLEILLDQVCKRSAISKQDTEPDGRLSIQHTENPVNRILNGDDFSIQHTGDPTADHPVSVCDLLNRGGEV